MLRFADLGEERCRCGSKACYQDAWWMHHHCFEDGDWKDYFGEDEPEDERWRRTGEE